MNEHEWKMILTSARETPSAGQLAIISCGPVASALLSLLYSLYTYTERTVKELAGDIYWLVGWNYVDIWTLAICWASNDCTRRDTHKAS